MVFRSFFKNSRVVAVIISDSWPQIKGKFSIKKETFDTLDLILRIAKDKFKNIDFKYLLLLFSNFDKKVSNIFSVRPEFFGKLVSKDF